MPANYFLKLDPEIKGEAQQSGFGGQIEILSYSWGVSQAGGFSFGEGGTSGQANLQDLSVSFRMNPASPKLMVHCASGKHLKGATLTCLKASGDKAEKYLETKLTDVVISSYQTGGSGDDVPIESMSLNFAKIEHEYFKQTDTGTVASAATASVDQQTKTFTGL